jgi:AMMECR1 domain-containing protein
VNSEADLDPKRYGVIVQAGRRRGLLLPDLEGVATVKMQVGIAMQKAGIAPGTPVTLFRFEVKRYH